MKMKPPSLLVILTIIRNKKNEFQIMRDGGMLKSFEADLMDSQMILQYGVRLGYLIKDRENRPVKVIDNFSTSTPCCPECKGTDVSTKVWHNLKNGSLESISTDEEDNYCNTCEEHVTLNDKKINRKIGIEIASIG